MGGICAEHIVLSKWKNSALIIEFVEKSSLSPKKKLLFFFTFNFTTVDDDIIHYQKVYSSF